MKKVEPREILALTNPNKAWVVKELDRLLNGWKEWFEIAKQLPISPDYDAQTCSESIQDGWDNRRKHEIIRDKTLVFIGNNFSGYSFLFDSWPEPPHETNQVRLMYIIPTWMQRLETLLASIEYARVPDGFWKAKGKQLAEEIIRAAPEKAGEIASAYLQNPTG